MAEITYDDRRLQQLFAELEPKRRLQALKGAFRREANEVRKTAVNNLRGKLRSNKDLENGIRAIVFKRTAGFRVTIGTLKGKRTAGYHLNRQGLLKPVLIWAEEGTQERQTKSKKGNARRASRLRASHRTGRMPRFGFMQQTLSDVKNSVTDDLHTQVRQNVERIAQKYGCK